MEICHCNYDVLFSKHERFTEQGFSLKLELFFGDVAEAGAIFGDVFIVEDDESDRQQDLQVCGAAFAWLKRIAGADGRGGAIRVSAVRASRGVLLLLRVGAPLVPSRCQVRRETARCTNYEK